MLNPLAVVIVVAGLSIPLAQAAQAGATHVQASQTATEGFIAYQRHDYASALRLWTIAANRGDPVAQFQIGHLYGAGEGVAKDPVTSAAWNRKAADHGLAGAQFVMGLMYSKGTGVAQDYAAAVNWERKAAAQGFPQAAHMLGDLYAKGHGVPMDQVQAAKWYRMSTVDSNGQ